MSKNKKGFGKLLLGLGLGAGLGVLFAPRSGKETREMLKNSIDDLVKKVKELDADDVKLQIEEKINSIRKELEDLDKEKAIKYAKEKGEAIKHKIEDLAELAREKATPVVVDAVEGLRKNAIKATKAVLTKLEKEENA